MPLDPQNELKIVESWHVNAGPWVSAVRGGQIESRRQITDKAIIDAVLSRSPRTVLDVGCGEGWLARELSVRDVHVAGIDAVARLVEEAQRAGGGEFHVVSYEGLATGAFTTRVDAVVCNFSLLGKESVEGVFDVASSLLNPGGTFIVQTLHPVTACGAFPYRDGWRDGSWTGFGSDFSNPAPWYFRTLESWRSLFAHHGFRVLEVREPGDPKSRKPVSALFIAVPGIHPSGE